MNNNANFLVKKMDSNLEFTLPFLKFQIIYKGNKNPIKIIIDMLIGNTLVKKKSSSHLKFVSAEL